MAGAWAVRVATTSTRARKIGGTRSGYGRKRRQLLAQVDAVAVWARRRGRGLAYQLLELLTAGGTRVFVDGHDVDTPNYPEMVLDIYAGGQILQFLGAYVGIRQTHVLPMIAYLVPWVLQRNCTGFAMNTTNTTIAMADLEA